MINLNYIHKRSINIALLLLSLAPVMPAHGAFVNYQKTTVISPVGPTAADNGLALVMGLTNITSGIPAPSPTDRYLLKLEPGIYDVGATSIQLPSYVDMEGSGEGVTLIRGNVDGALPANQGLVTVGQNAGIRHLTVENNASGDSSDSAAILLLGSSRANHVTAIATGESVINRALVTGLDAKPAPRISSVTATATTRAVHVFFPGLDAENLVAKGKEGLLVSSGDVFARNSRFEGSNFSLLVTNLPQTVDIVTSQLTGKTICTFKNCRCFASYNANLHALKPNCANKKAKKEIVARFSG